MDPIFRSFFDLPSRQRYPPSARHVPVQAQPERAIDRPQRVVQIPVRFVESERSRSDAAVKIQKVFRGFFVRKNLKKISAIKEEVMAIEKKISKEESVLILRNSRERLIVNEMLMSLLLRLDSVRAADAGVRDYRRSVIKKAIALQEHLDAIVQSGDEKAVVEADEVAKEPAAQGTELHASVSEHNCDVPENEEIMDQFQGTEMSHNSETNNVSDSDHNCDLQENEEDVMEDVMDQFSVTEISNHSETDNVADSELVAEDLNKKEIFEDAAAVESQSGSTESPVGEPESAAENDGESKGAIVKEESRSEGEELKATERESQLLKRMVEENEKMMRMMAELVNRNEKQTRLLSSLTQRVEQLERAFVWDKLRRMKKRSAEAGCVDGYDKSPDNRKNGKR